MVRVPQEWEHLIFVSSDGKRSSKTLLHSPPSRGNYRSLLQAGHLEAGRFCRASEQACRGSCSLDEGPQAAAATCAEVAGGA